MRNYLRVLLALVLCCLVTICAFADGDTIKGCIIIDGTSYALDKTNSGPGWTYNGSLVLTLHGFSGQSISFYPVQDDPACNLTLVLEGENEISGGLSSEVGMYMSAGHPGGTLTITGSGSLAVGRIDSRADNTIFQGGHVTAGSMNGASTRTITVRKGAVLRGVSSGSMSYILGMNPALTIDGGVVELIGQGDGYFWSADNHPSIINGGTLLLTRTDGGDALFVRVSAISDLYASCLVTSQSGGQTSCYSFWGDPLTEDDWNGYVRTNSTAALNNVRIIGGIVGDAQILDYPMLCLDEADTSAVNCAYNNITNQLLISGDISATNPVFIAAYDDKGRMLSVEILYTLSTVDANVDDAATAKVFWLNSDSAPKSGSAQIDLTEGPDLAG